jgi:hypothetical protein
MPTINFSYERAKSIVKENDEDFEVIEKKYLDQCKGVFRYKVIVKQRSTGKHYRSFFQSGYKPSLGSSIEPYQRDKPDFVEVEFREVVITDWVEVEDKEKM